MVNPTVGPKRIVVRANVETLGLLVGAVVVTLALASSIHSRQAQQPVPVAASEPPQDWAGHLSEVAVDQVQTAVVEPLSSASLVVPKSQLALPTLQPRPKTRTCDGAACPAKALTSTAQASREKIEPVAPLPASRGERSLISRLNPLNHLPDMNTLGRPFAYAGDTISGWVRRF